MKDVLSELRALAPMVPPLLNSCHDSVVKILLAVGYRQNVDGTWRHARDTTANATFEEALRDAAYDIEQAFEPLFDPKAVIPGGD